MRRTKKFVADFRSGHWKTLSFQVSWQSDKIWVFHICSCFPPSGGGEGMLGGHQNKLQIRIQDTRKPFSFKFHQNRMKIKISQVTPPPLGGGNEGPPFWNFMFFMCRSCGITIPHYRTNFDGSTSKNEKMANFLWGFHYFLSLGLPPQLWGPPDEIQKSEKFTCGNHA